MIKNIIWTDRYSESDLSDKFGRWARVGYLKHKSNDVMKQIQIAWISKIENRFISRIHIGSNGISNSFDELDEAKNYCQKILNDFSLNY